MTAMKRFVQGAVAIGSLLATACHDDEPKDVPVELVDLPQRPPGRVFTNPIVNGADPYLTHIDDRYYLLLTEPGAVGVYFRSSPSVTGLAEQDREFVWNEPPNQEADCCLWWAPELYRLDGKYYIYTSAGRTTLTHRLLVLESDDPSAGFLPAGNLGVETWGIDPSVVEVGPDDRYLVWSAHIPGSIQQRLLIARMASPTSIEGEPVQISTPDQPWEQNEGLLINEGPVALYGPDGAVHVVYSANFSQTDHYCLGALTLTRGGDPLDPSAWAKSEDCLFSKNEEASVFGPGHGSFTMSPDGTETFNVYHANPVSGAGWRGRNVRMQQVGFRRSGLPALGRPVSTDTELQVPSGEEGSDRRRVEAEYGTMDDAIEIVWDPDASSGQVVRVSAASLTFPPVDAGVGTNTMRIRYRSEAESRIALAVDGKVLAMRLPSTDGVYRAAEFVAALGSGRHAVELDVVEGELFVDALEVPK